jgi:sarcosine oxidase subunit beta
VKTCDAIVIGAGSVGLPAAYFLAEKGLSVVVLEARASPGQGQNKAAIGGVRATHSDPAKIQLGQQSLEIFSRWEEEHGFDIGWKTGGYCFPVYTEELEETLRRLLRAQKSFDLDIDWVDPETIADLIPGIEKHGLRGGTYSPGDGQASPLLSAEGFRRGTVELGGEFRFEEPVVGITVEGGRITEVTTTKERYSAPLVLNAAGGRARQVGELCGLEVPVTPDSHEAGISAPVAPFLDPLVVDMRPGPEGKTANFYFGQNREGQIIFCYTPIEPIIGEDRRSTSEFLPVVGQRLVRLVPRLKNLLIRRIWRGLYPMTPDGVPIMDEVREIEGLYLAVGMCGQGYMLGPGVGLNMASLMVEGRAEIDPEVFSALSFYRDFSGGVETLK